jgi:Asp-tRNA(Asn)/Glu-tRNA(Gln) amidotransferase A subunit family amidase
MTDSLCFTPATELADRITSGDLSPTTVVDAHLDRIDERNDRTNAYVTVLREHARERARDAERTIANDERWGPLHGVPVAIKDLSPMAGVRTTNGSKPFADNVADTDAILVERLRDAGAIPLGKTNACEFGHKGTTDNRLFGPTSTPFDLDLNAGGSSGGSAAAVADGIATVAMGGDGGGSIRIPAACCGVYGFVPSFGRVPHEVRPDAFNEHTPFVRRGPLTRSVGDAAAVMEVIAGPDPRDPFSLPEDGTDYISAVERDISDLSVAYSPNLGLFPVQTGVRDVLDDAVDALSAAGADITAVDPPFDRSLEELFEVWGTIWEAMYAGIAESLRATGFDLLGDHRSELSPVFAEGIEAGLELDVTDLKRANRARTEIRDTLRSVYADHDLLVTATTTRPPVENTDETVGPETVGGEFVGSPIGWCLTYPFNLVENPSASVPAGLDRDGLPVGLQLVGDRFDDETVLAASAALERERPWRAAYPGLGDNTNSRPA